MRVQTRKKLKSLLAVVNKNKKFLYFLNKNEYKLKNSFDCKVLILAGGKGKRLLPLTKFTPKPILKIGYIVGIKKLVDDLRSQGFKDISVSVKYKSEKIINFFKKEKYFKDLIFLKEKNFRHRYPIALIKKK